MTKHSSLNEFVDGMRFLRELHSLYKDLGGMKNNETAKGFLLYVAKENEMAWHYVVQFIFYLFEQIDKKGISKCKENIDWEKTCRKCYPKILDLTKTKSAFKDLFYLIAMNKGDDIDELIAESILSAYGWHFSKKMCEYAVSKMYNSFADHEYKKYHKLSRKYDEHVINSMATHG